MPRILPRLFDALAQAKRKPLSPSRVPPDAFKRRKRASLFRPLPPVPPFSPHGRTQSIVLDDVNPIAQPHDFGWHKAQPPKIRIYRDERPRHLFMKGKEQSEFDPPRRMTSEERRWYSNPYLRMIASPTRRCIVTGRHLPADLLVRLTTVRPTAARLSSRDTGLLVPDGLSHSKFRARRAGKGFYILCWRAALDEVLVRSGEFARYGSVHTLLRDQIAHLLRNRVLHELAILAHDLRHRPRHAATAPVLRRLTRAEFADVRAGTAPLPPGALAMLVVPPVNCDPKTKERPKPHLEENPVPSDEASSPKRPPLPLSVLLPATSGAELGGAPREGPPAHAKHRVPRYNGVTAFPARAQRAALHKGLCDVLYVERRARWREEGRPEPGQEKVSRESKWARGDAKASHAFLLCSDEHSIVRSDPVPLALALWRLRMWEGDAWESEDEPWDVSSLP